MALMPVGLIGTMVIKPKPKKKKLLMLCFLDDATRYLALYYIRSHSADEILRCMDQYCADHAAYLPPSTGSPRSSNGLPTIMANSCRRRARLSLGKCLCATRRSSTLCPLRLPCLLISHVHTHAQTPRSSTWGCHGSEATECFQTLRAPFW